MFAKIKRGSTSVILPIFITDTSSSTGAGLTGLTYASSNLTAYYKRDGDTAATAITLETATLGAYTSSGFAEVDSTNMPGVYEIGIPNAALSLGKWVVVMLKGVSNMKAVSMKIDLQAFDDQESGVTVSGYASGEDPATLVLDALLSAHATTGSVGKAISSTSTGGIDTSALSQEIWSAASRTLTESYAKPGDEMILTSAAYSQIANSVLDAPASDFSQSGSVGEAISEGAKSSVDLTAAACDEVATTLLDMSISSHENSGSVGAAIVSSAEITVDSDSIASKVWSYSGRALTTFGSLAADVWAVVLETVKSASGSIGKYILDRLSQINTDLGSSISPPPASSGEIVAGIDLVTAQKMLNAWKEAELAVAVAGQSYQLDIGGNKRVMTRANLAEIQAQIKYWRRQVADFSGKRRIGYID